MVHALDHVTFVCADLAPMTAFFATALGLRSGPRPPFGVPGDWLYAGDAAVVHLLLGAPATGTSAFDHVAFAATDRRATCARLTRAGVPFRVRRLPDGSAVQVFVAAPNGVRVELVFREGEDLLDA